MALINHEGWKEHEMTEAITYGKPSKRRWALFVGVLVVILPILLIGFALFMTDYYPMQRQAVVKFIYSIKYGINIGDGGVISDVPCSSPCVFGIRAGETQFDQVMPLLEKNGIASSDCLTEPNISWFLFYCGVGRLNVQVDTHTNIVNGIWFYPNDSISLGEIIEKHGEPDFFMISPEGPTLQLSLFWDPIKMGVVLPKIDGKIYVVEPTTYVEGIDFSDETTYPGSFKIDLGAAYKLWNGYGTYQP